MVWGARFGSWLCDELKLYRGSMSSLLSFRQFRPKWKIFWGNKLEYGLFINWIEEFFSQNSFILSHSQKIRWRSDRSTREDAEYEDRTKIQEVCPSSSLQRSTWAATWLVREQVCDTKIYFRFLIRCCVRGVVCSCFHSWRGRVIFRAIKVKAIVSRSDRSISFCAPCFSFSLSLSFIFSNSNDFASNSLFHCLFRSIETYRIDQLLVLFSFFFLFSAYNFQ